MSSRCSTTFSPHSRAPCWHVPGSGPSGSWPHSSAARTTVSHGDLHASDELRLLGAVLDVVPRVHRHVVGRHLRVDGNLHVEVRPALRGQPDDRVTFLRK